jgi:hypothetical protein
MAGSRRPNRNNGSGHTRPSPPHGIVNASVIALGILLAGGVPGAIPHTRLDRTQTGHCPDAKACTYCQLVELTVRPEAHQST